MEVSQLGLLYMLLGAFVCGGLLGVLYDGLYMLRQLLGIGGPEKELSSPRLCRLRGRLRLSPPLAFRTKKTKPLRGGPGRQGLAYAVLFLQDILFCLCAALTAILLLYATNDGQFRFSALVVMALGHLAYRAFPGRLIRVVWAYVLELIRGILRYALALAVYPARLLWRCTIPLRRRIAAYICARRAQYQQKREARRQRRQERRERSRYAEQEPEPSRSPRRPPDGKTVFARGGGERGKKS